MSLHDELTKGTSTACRICTYLRGLPAAEAQEWDRELALPLARVSNQAVVDALYRRDIVLTEASVRRHRRNHVER